MPLRSIQLPRFVRCNDPDWTDRNWSGVMQMVGRDATTCRRFANCSCRVCHKLSSGLWLRPVVNCMIRHPSSTRWAFVVCHGRRPWHGRHGVKTSYASFDLCNCLELCEGPSGLDGSQLIERDATTCRRFANCSCRVCHELSSGVWLRPVSNRMSRPPSST